MSKIILLDTEHAETVNVFLNNHTSMAAELPERFKAGVTHFAFKKADGSFRNAFGTLDPEFLPVRTPEQIEEQAAKAKAPNPDMQPYWDIEAKGWRAFSKDRLIAIF